MPASNIHQINLSRMWVGHELACEKMDWQLALSLERPITLTRNFKCPTGLSDDAIVYLEFKDVAEAVVCLLNQTEIEPVEESDSRVATQRFEITRKLKPSNQIQVVLATELDASHQANVQHSSVTLSIHDPAV